MTEQPILYSFRRCPYAMRARLALTVAGITCRLREVVLREKPPEMLAASPKGTVPVLVLPDGNVIEESLAIMEWALGQSDPQAWLSPQQGNEADLRALIAACDGPFKQHLDRYKYPNRYGDIDPTEHRSQGHAFLTQLNDRLRAGQQLFGDRISLADIAIFPFVRQFANTDRDWFDAQALPGLQGWLTAHLGSALFTGIMHKYAQWQSGDAEPDFPPDAVLA